MFWILLVVSAILVISDSSPGWSMGVFSASGLLGVMVFGTPLVAGGMDGPVNVLFPALAGLFGVAGLLFAIATSAPPSDRSPALGDSSNPTFKAVGAPSVRGGMAGLIVGLLPGLGAANAATLLLLIEEKGFGRKGTREDQERAYLVTTSSLNTAEALFAIVALYLIGRSRSGASIAVEQILGGGVLAGDLLQITLFMAFAGGVSAVILWRMGQWLASWMTKVNESGLNWSIVAFLACFTLLLLGFGGLLVLACATAVGLMPLVANVRRAQLMGFFLVPTMLFYSGHQALIVDWLALEQRTSPSFGAASLWEIFLAVLVAAAASTAAYQLAARLATGARPRAKGSRPGRIANWVTATASGAALIAALAEMALPEGDLSAPGAHGAEGRIVRMVDGDTADIASACRRFRVRLSGIDAPELGTAAGDLARDWARSRFENQPVTWGAVGIDTYGRVLGQLWLQDGTLINRELVCEGYAKLYAGPERGDTPQSRAPTFAPCPSEASSQRQDALGEAEAVDRAPWDDNGNGRVSCAEARAHGIAPVSRDHPAYPYMSDGDGDGVVCE